MSTKRGGREPVTRKRRPVAPRPRARRPVPRQAAMPPAGRVAAFQRFIGEVFRLNGQLLASAEGMSRGIGVSPARWQTIAVIRDEPLPIAQIARRLGLRRQSVQHNVDRLVSQGIAVLQANPHHRRASLVALTDKGQAVMRQLRALQARLTTLFIGKLDLSAADLESLADTLREIRQQAGSDDAL